jgi:hypothetical protein
MVGKVLKFFGWQNRIDLSPAGLDDLKVIGFLLITFVLVVFGIIMPWMYGIVKIALLIFK